jgi:hypothetical protein
MSKRKKLSSRKRYMYISRLVLFLLPENANAVGGGTREGLAVGLELVDLCVDLAQHLLFQEARLVVISKPTVEMKKFLHLRGAVLLCFMRVF